LVKIFLVFSGTQTFIAMCTETVYPTCYGASAILSTNSLHRLFVLNSIMQYTCSGLQGELFYQNFRKRVTSIKLNPNLFPYLPNRHYRSWLVTLTLPPIYPRGREPVPTTKEAGRISGPAWMGRESLAPSGFDPPKHPARSESLYRLQYDGCNCVVFLVTSTSNWGIRWRSWLRHCATNRKVAGSIPDGVIEIFRSHNPSGRTMTLGLT